MLCTLLVFIQYFFFSSFFCCFCCAVPMFFFFLFSSFWLVFCCCLYFILLNIPPPLRCCCCTVVAQSTLRQSTCVYVSCWVEFFPRPLAGMPRGTPRSRALSRHRYWQKRKRHTVAHTHTHTLTHSFSACWICNNFPFPRVSFYSLRFVSLLLLFTFFSFPLFLFVYWLSVTLVDLNVVIAISIRLSLITYLAPLSFFFFYLFFSCQHACLCLSHFLWLGALVSLEDRLCRLDSRSKKKKNWYRFRSFVSSIGIWQVDYWSKRVLMLQKLERWIAHFPRGVSSSKGGEILHRGSP